MKLLKPIDIQHFGEDLTSGMLSPWRFASKRIDEETGFVYFGRRYYSPILGRWITPDPQGNKDGPNLYAYVHNSPLLAIDLYGLEANGNSGFWKGVFDYFYNGFRELGPHVCSRIKMGWEMQHRLVKDPVGHGKWMYGKGNRFISQIPNEMNWQSVKNGSFNALESFFPCTADAIAQVGHYQNNYERGYHIGKAASEIAVFVFATTFAELAVERFAMSKSLKVSSTLTQELAESKAIANIAKQEVQFGKQNPCHKISQLEEKLSEWLGKEIKMIKNKAGDPVFLSKDMERRIRFDFNNPHGDRPHMHIEKKINSKWKDAANQHRIYPFKD